MDKEIEARFLEVDKEALVDKLLKLGAKDLGENTLEEVIIYDPELKWLDERRFVRLRKTGESTRLTYKEHRASTVDGAHEIELGIEDLEKAVKIFESIGLLPYRRQQKRRHTLHLDKVVFDIDTWPKIPTYVELEGPSEEVLKNVASKLGLDWGKAVFEDARKIIEGRYNIPVGTMRWFTFDRFE